MLSEMISSVSQKNATARKTKRVLYVDDMRELRDVARLALTRVGHKVDTAPDGADAFAMIVKNSAAYDMVITDHHMAGMNGLELVMKLREINFPGMIAIVSSELNSDVEHEYRALGVERILNKPVELARLRALVLES
jgi:two-component system, chemotaxis family, chemotaxis protein CheY